MPTSVFEQPAVQVQVNSGTLINNGDAVVYYRDQLPVSATENDGQLTIGQSAILDGSQYLVSALRSTVTIVPLGSQGESGGPVADGSVNEDKLSAALKATLVIGRVHDGANYPERKDGYAFNHWVGPSQPPDYENGDVWTPTA